MRPEPIRLLHFADLHIGIENYGRLGPPPRVSTAGCGISWTGWTRW